jgi:syntaxin 6
MAQDDPFFIFRGDLVKKLLVVEGQLDRYLEVVRTTVSSYSTFALIWFINSTHFDIPMLKTSYQDTATNTHEIKETKKLLKRHLKAAESTLSDLETTIRVVEKNRSKFPHISDVEVNSRRNFVSDSQARIQNSRDEMQSNEVKDKLLSDEKAKTARRKALTNNSSKINKSTRQSLTDDLHLEEEGEASRSETMLMMQQQDDTLDGLSSAVTRVSHMAGTIHEEIETQNKMLTELEDDLVDAEEQLGTVMGKLGKLLKTKNRCQIGLILILSLVVLVLFFLVLYT